MSFGQNTRKIFVLDETQLSFAIFVLPKHHHFKFCLFDVSNSFWSKELQNKPRYDEWGTDAPRKVEIQWGKSGDINR